MSERYYDWQKAILSEMPSLADEDVSDKLPERAIVRFVSDENGRPISRSYKKVLIVDKFTKNKVSPGDAWLCTLAEQSSCIVAYPDQKITTEMLAGLDKRLFDSLVDEIWEHQGSSSSSASTPGPGRSSWRKRVPSRRVSINQPSRTGMPG